MPQERQYVIDTNVLIEAKNRYYAFDLAPAFWEALIEKASSGILCSIDRVRDETNRGNDELKEWVNDRFSRWCVSTDATEIIEAYRRIMLWAMGNTQYTDAAKAEFARLENADAWVVAYAMVTGCIVVTHEVYNAAIRKEMPIPNVCREFGVDYITTFDMMRNLGIRLDR